MAMFALVNTFNKPHESFGVVWSVHRSVEAAEKANDATQAAVKRGNGNSSYIPTTIVRLKKRLRSGDVIGVNWIHDKEARLSRIGSGPDREVAEPIE